MFSFFKKKKTVSFTPISETDKVLAMKAWVQVENSYVIVSKALYTKLFKNYPETKNFFVDLLSDNGAEDAFMTPRFEKHMVQTLMPYIGKIFRFLDEPDVIVQDMQDLGKLHKRKRMGLKPEHVEILKNVIIETLRDFMGNNMFIKHENAVRNVLTSAFNIFEAQL